MRSAGAHTAPVDGSSDVTVHVRSASSSVLGPTPAIEAVLAATRGRLRSIVLIDGPSGAGKSTFADRLLAVWSRPAARLVRLDQVYPGWHGLDPGAAGLRRDLVDSLARDAPARWRRWDWSAEAVAAIERMPPGRPLIVEGCGAFAAGAGVHAAVRVWVTAPDDARRRRALDRDGGGFDDYWDLWEAQWRRHVARGRPDRRAHLRVRIPGVVAPDRSAPGDLGPRGGLR